jgi:hypothetical protein
VHDQLSDGKKIRALTIVDILSRLAVAVGLLNKIGFEIVDVGDGHVGRRGAVGGRSRVLVPGEKTRDGRGQIRHHFETASPPPDQTSLHSFIQFASGSQGSRTKAMRP